MKLIFKTSGVYAKAETAKDLETLMSICRPKPFFGMGAPVKARVKCEICGRSFRGAHGLNIHTKVIHTKLKGNERD